MIGLEIYDDDGNDILNLEYGKVSIIGTYDVEASVSGSITVSGVSYFYDTWYKFDEFSWEADIIDVYKQEYPEGFTVFAVSTEADKIVHRVSIVNNNNGNLTINYTPDEIKVYTGTEWLGMDSGASNIYLLRNDNISYRYFIGEEEVA